MSGQLYHTPSQIVRQLLIDLSVGSDHGADWPVFAMSGGDRPDDAIVVADTAGRINGRLNISGRVQELHGINVVVRSDNYQQAYAKASEIKKKLSENVALTPVLVSDTEEAGTGQSSYLVYNVIQTSGPIPVSEPNTNRKFFSTNFLVNLEQTSS